MVNIMDIFGAHEVTVSRVQQTPTGATVDGPTQTVSGVFFTRKQRLTRTPNGEQVTSTAQVSVPPSLLPLFKADGKTRVTVNGESFTVAEVDYTAPPVTGMPDAALVVLL